MAGGLLAGKGTCDLSCHGLMVTLIAYVASTYYCPLLSLVLFFLEFVQLQQRQLLLLLYQSRLDLVRLQLVLEYHNVFDRRWRRRPHPYYWNLPRPWNSWFHRRNIPEDIARWEKRLEQTLIKASFFRWRKIIDVSMMNAVRLTHRCLKSHHMQNLINICEWLTFVLNTHLSAHNLLDS